MDFTGCFGESQEGGAENGDSSRKGIHGLGGKRLSAGWVFPGWVSWSKRFRRKHGVYPDEMYPGILAKLARMSKRERDEIILPELMKM